ncbi:MAG: PQQ-binding-like beta-propeller repeat protein [Planctomycetota bacterium]
MKRFMALVVCGAIVWMASAQHDNSTWPTFRATTLRVGSATAAGPAVNLAWRVSTPYGPAPGGFTVSAAGDIYYLSGEADGGASHTFAFRLNPATGAVLAQSPVLGGQLGCYGGVAVGAGNECYVTVYAAADSPLNGIVVLDKQTLAIVREFRNDPNAPIFGRVQGTPYISDVLNNQGHRNLYVHDRNARALHAIDSVSGAHMWTAVLEIGDLPMGQFGPCWVDGGKQIIAIFGNSSLLGGYAIQDNGDNTYTQLWNGGPFSFNWWGSGAMSADNQRIYVTTFNDAGADALWAINKADGNVVWSVPGNRGDPNLEHNFFGRPATYGNRVYCGGGYGVVACFEDNGASYTKMWELRDFYGEHTCVSVAHDSGTNATYVYAAKQEQIDPDPNDPNNDPPHIGAGELIVLRDDGNTFTELLRTDLDGTMLKSLYATTSLTIDGAGNLYVGSGWPNNAGLGPADIYKFTPAPPICRGDCNCDDFVDFGDINPFVQALSDLPGWQQQYPNCPLGNPDVNGDGHIDFGDINPFVAILSAGGGPCP